MGEADVTARIAELGVHVDTAHKRIDALECRCDDRAATLTEILKTNAAVYTEVTNMKENQQTHLQHHWAITSGCLLTLVAVIISQVFTFWFVRKEEEKPAKRQTPVHTSSYSYDVNEPVKTYNKTTFRLYP